LHSSAIRFSDVDRGVDAERVLDSINPFSFTRTAKKILEFNPQLVLISYWMPFFARSLGSAARRIRKKSSSKIISIMHNVLPHEKRTGDTYLTNHFIKHCDGFVVLNDKSRYDLLALKPDAKFIVLPHPLYDHYGEKIENSTAREKLGIPAGKKVLLFFGLIRDYKGVDLLLEALAGLDESYFLIIAGEVYGNFGKYNSIIESHSLQNRVLVHTKFIPESEITYYFSASDVCVLPYRSGTQSGIEGVAYHFGVPVIVTDVGGLKETVETYKTGLVVPKPDTEMLKDAIKNFFESGSTLPAQYKANIEAYKSKNSWDRFSQELMEFYGSLR
jgi:glycosyltransferase involved in cell wall biosynthesis